MRYKVGDVVTVRNDLVIDKFYGEELFVIEMNCMKGKKVTIKNIEKHGYRICECGFNWTDEMFEETFENDKSITYEKSNNSKALFIGLMDISGSMGQTTKIIGKAYLNLVKSSILAQGYEMLDENYIAYTTAVKDVQNDISIFDREYLGGTYISAGLKRALEIINTYNENYDIYVVNCSDGGNWIDDNDMTIKLTKEICEKVCFYTFTEIKTSTYMSTISSQLRKEINSDRLNVINLHSMNDVKKEFPKILQDDKFGIRVVCHMTKEDLERINRYKNISKIFRDGDKTTVIFQNGARGEAIKYAHDIYNEEIGFKVAYAKAKVESAKLDLKKLIDGIQ